MNFLRKFSLLFGVLILLASPLYPLGSARAAITSTWIDGDMPVLSDVSTQTPSLPAVVDCYDTSFSIHSYTTPGGIFDRIGRYISIPVCAKNSYSKDPDLRYGASSGLGTSDDFIAFGPSGFRILDTSGARATGVTPILGDDTTPLFMYNQPDGNLWGGTSIRLFNLFSGTFGPVYGSIREDAYTMDIPAVQPFRDNVGNIIHMMNNDFSNNNKWMVFEANNLGLIRLNLETKTMQLFSTEYYSYNLGFRPAVVYAVSDDGNTVIKSGKDLPTVAYDLSACRPGPFVVAAGPAANAAAAQGCRSRVLSQSVTQQLSDFRGFMRMKFSSDQQSLDVAALGWRTGGFSAYRTAKYSLAGYVQPESVNYLALGDSFSSGEGERGIPYALGTDESENQCHLSTNSYPFLAALAVGLTTQSFHSVACSGAKTINYFYKPQNDNTGDFTWKPGEEKQQEYVRRANPNTITISMIGNDIGFSSKITRCLAAVDACFHFKEDRQSIAEEINSKFNTLVGLYKDIQNKAPGAKIYVLGYPQLAATSGSCGLNMPLNTEEREMAQGLVSYLNATIKGATENAGVAYIDVENAFTGHRLCETGKKAVNGMTAGYDMPVGIGPIANESFHPNELGHQLMAQNLLSQSRNFTLPMPQPDTTKTYPSTNSSVYNSFIGSAPSGSKFDHLVYISLGFGHFVLPKVSLSPGNIKHLLKPSSIFTVSIFSTPTHITDLSTDSTGRLTGEFTIPETIAPGYHTLEIVGPNVVGEQTTYYQDIYVANSLTDYDGDGIPNTQDTCVAIEPSGVDEDRDGVDDACDPEITDPPADNLPPVVTGTPDHLPNPSNWYKDNVLINWLSTDPQPSSGTPSQPVPTTADLEGTNTYTSAASCDPLNNCASGNLSLNIDKTAPEMHHSTTPVSPNSNNWFNSDVGISFTCTDATSGLDAQLTNCPASQSITSEGVDQPASATATDYAGNTSVDTATVNIDKTAPIFGAANWTNNPKTTMGTATLTAPVIDNLSGVSAAEYYIGDTDPGRGHGATSQINGDNLTIQFNTDYPTGVFKVTYRAQDIAGNWSPNTTDYLVVYDPFGARMTGKRTLLPQLANGDILPGLISPTQTNKAKFGFNIRYNKYGQMHPNSDFQFEYETGSNCHKPSKAINCHELELNATSIEWLTTQGVNDSTGVFQGTAKLEIDDQTKQTVLFRVIGLDVERANIASTPDHLLVQIFNPTDNPNTATPIYTVNDDVLRGNIKVWKW